MKMINRKRALHSCIKASVSLLILVGLSSCDKDNFTDPNDEQFGGKNTITLKLSETFQTIDHFGASGGFDDQWVGKWPDQSREQVAKLLFSSEVDEQGNPEGIALSLWRSVIGDGAADQMNSGFSPSNWYTETECYLRPDGTYDWNKQQGTQWFLERAKAYGVNKFSAWATTPPYFLTKNGYTFSTSEVNGFNCPPSNYEAYALFLANVLNHYSTMGYNFETVSPFNETQYEWSATVGTATQSGTSAYNSEMATFLRLADNVFTAQNVNAKMMVSEAAQLKNLFEGSGNTTNQLGTFFNESSPDYIGNLNNLSTHIAGHSYFSNDNSAESIRQREGLRNKLQQIGGGHDYWQTEFSLLGSEYLQGRPMNSLSEIDYALFLSRIIHTDLVFGNATGWSFWTALNQSGYEDHPYRFNLIFYQPNSNGPSHTGGTFDDVKNLWALGNYSRFVRPGMVRFNVVDPQYSESNSAVEKFMVSGYKSDDTVVLVFTNNTNSERAISFKNYGSDFSFINNTVEMYTTSASQNLERSQVPNDGIVIPAKSIVTVRAKLQ